MSGWQKRELNETILRDMPKQILDEYKISEDVERVTEQATNEENNDEVEKLNKEEEIKLLKTTIQVACSNTILDP